MKLVEAEPQKGAPWDRALLAETDDAELQQIVEEAAQELSSPMALITLVLDEVQFFKAHWGLPADLAAARATRRDVSFCQFVVRDEAPFEVTDAPNDSRVPQYLVEEYGVRAYLGVPIRLADTVVGSLCVLDTKERRFTADERQNLHRLATAVDERLKALIEHRRRARLELAHAASAPALAELRQSLEPVRGAAASVNPAIVALRSFLRLSAHAIEGGAVSTDALQQSLAAADDALERAEDLLEDIRSAALDSEDCLRALEHLTMPSESCRLSEVITAAQDLTRPSTRAVGGAPLPELSYDPPLRVSRPLAVALLAGAISAVAEHLADAGASRGLRLEVRDMRLTAEVGISAEGFTEAAARAVATRLSEQIGELPNARVALLSDSLRVAFRVVDPEGEDGGARDGKS